MNPDSPDLGRRLHDFCRLLYPIPRSLTGDGVRRTLAAIGERMPLDVHEVPSGTRVFDWTVPDEWNIRQAWICAPDGRRVVDMSDHTLHVVGYSEPVHARMSLDALQAHLHSIPEHPDWIPYRTSYYEPAWGFCLAHRVRESLVPGEYEVCIDTQLGPGHLTYGERLIPGELSQEFVISVHVCHPSLANDNLSGIAVATGLAEWLGSRRNRYSYRIVYVPSTIGAITWLALNESRLERIVGGMVISGVGDRGPITYKRSRHGDTVVDRTLERTLRESGVGHRIEPFSPYGYDERQYCSPGIDLGVGCLMRTPFGRYPQYHTSGDDLGFIAPDQLAEALRVCVAAISNLENVAVWRNTNPKGEPQLGRRGLYDAIGGENDKKAAQMALLWMLSYSDGKHSTLDIAERSAMPLELLDRAARRLEAAGLLSR